LVHDGYRNLEITFYLGTPLALGPTSRYPLCFDALLMAVAAGPLPTGIDPVPGPYGEIPIPLAKDETGTFYRASSLAVLAPRCISQDAWVQQFTEAVVPHTALKKVEVGRGALRNKNDPLYLVAAPAVRFWAVGNPEAVARLVAKVHYLGLRRAAGYGKVVRRTIAYSSYDYSVVDPDGNPARPVPAFAWPSAPPGWELWRAAYRPPYWRPENVDLCYMPPAWRWWPGKEELPEWMARL
jgi:hypothetical protein